MHTIAVSDIHVGWNRSNTDDFVQFMNEEVSGSGIDQFLILGDLFEFWRRGISSVLIEHTEVVDTINELHKSDIEIKILSGNHDWRMSEISFGSFIDEDTQWNVVDEHTFTSGDEKFKAVHGHKFDAVNANNAQNEALCLTSDVAGEAIAGVYDGIIYSGPLTSSISRIPPIFNRVNLGVFEHVANPGALSAPENRGRWERVTDRATVANDEFLLWGHTHIPKIEDDNANCGSWTGNENTYLEIIDGDISLESY